MRVENEAGVGEKRYETKLTAQGAAALAACVLDGVKLAITHIAAGDGGGAFCEPLPEQTALVREVWRGEVLACEKNPLHPNMMDIKGVIPSDAGGFVVRELGVFDKDGTLIGVCNTPEMEKETLSSGAGGKLDLMMHLIVTDANAVQVFVKPSLDTISLEDALKLIDERVNNIEDMVTAPGGGHMEMAEGLGAGPYAIEVDEEEDLCAARSCRISVGTSAAGWTEGECDYLCDGEADDEEINAAIAALLALGGGKLVLLAGTYHLAGDVLVADDHGGAYVEAEDYKSVWLCGEGGGTVLSGPHTIQHEKCRLRISSLCLEDVKIYGGKDYGSLAMSDCSLTSSGGNAVLEESYMVDVRNCRFSLNSKYEPGKALTFLLLYAPNAYVQGNTMEIKSEPTEENVCGISARGQGMVSGDGNSRILRNVIISCGIGIEAAGSYVNGNVISDAITGISCGESCIVSENSICHVRKTGIYVKRSNVQIVGNCISRYSPPTEQDTHKGIELSRCDGCIVYQNYIQYLQTGIVAYSFRRQEPYLCKTAISENIVDCGKTGIQLLPGTYTSNGATVACQSHNLLVLGNHITAGTASIEISSAFQKCLISQNMCPDAPIVNAGSGNTVTGNITP